MANDSLKFLRNAVTAAETRLEEARAKMRTEAERLGISHHGLFAGSAFIYRATGQRWADDARREGRHEGYATVVRAIEATNNPEGSPFSHLSGVGTPARELAVEEVAHAILAAGKKARGQT